MRRIWTLFVALSQQCDSSPEGKAETKALDGGLALIERGHFLDTEFHENIKKLEIAQKALSPQRTFAHLAGTLFMAEAARQFPSDAYVSPTRSTAIYRGWVIAASIDESTTGPEHAASGFGGGTPPPKQKLN